MKSEEVKISVNKMFKTGGKLVREETTEDVVFVARIDENAAYSTVSSKKGATINMGNYSSANVSVFMSVPCPLDDEQVELAYEYVTNFVEGKMKECIEDLK